MVMLFFVFSFRTLSFLSICCTLFQGSRIWLSIFQTLLAIHTGGVWSIEIYVFNNYHLFTIRIGELLEALDVVEHKNNTKTKLETSGDTSPSRYVII